MITPAYFFNFILIIMALRIKMILLGLLFIFVVWAIYQFTLNYPTSSTLKTGSFPHDPMPESDARLLLDHNLNPITVTVYYECLCPDSRSFFIHHLLPAVLKAPDLVSVDLIPYGKAQTQKVAPDQYMFHCQHGPVECYGNKIHACAISRIKDSVTRLKVVSCMIEDNLNPEEIGDACCKIYGVSWQPILDCAKSLDGDKLLEQHGERTHALAPHVTFIPTVLLNQRQENQAAILKNLWREICNHYTEAHLNLGVCQ